MKDVDPQKMPAMPMAVGFVFPGAYGGAVQSPNPPQIHDMMKKLRVEIGAVKAVKAAGGPMFPVRGAKDLAQKLANALNELNMEAPVVAQEVTILDADKVPKNENKSGNPVFRTLTHVKATVRLIAPDTSFIDMVGSGHGGDVDDKSGGKASTYAWKDAILKGLSIPHDDMVDTDDDSTVAPAVRGPGAPTPERTKVEHPESATPTDAQGLAYVTAQIAKAETLDALEAVKKAIQDGTLALHGSDRLKASKLYVERKNALGPATSGK